MAKVFLAHFLFAILEMAGDFSPCQKHEPEQASEPVLVVGATGQK